jgi:hypothetical protein
LFAITIFIACASVLLKQLQLQTMSSILILTAGIAISLVIVIWLLRGIRRERASLGTAKRGSFGTERK